MDVFVYGALCAEGAERECAYQLLSVAVEQLYRLETLPSIARENGGKPFFPDRPDICFNLSHSRGAAVCAVHESSVGVDVEKLRRAPKRLADGMEDLAFFRLWTAKEASVKREGKGIAALLRDFEPDGLCRTVEEFLPGWIVTVCPSEPTKIRWIRVER